LKTSGTTTKRRQFGDDFDLLAFYLAILFLPEKFTDRRLADVPTDIPSKKCL
jgi:hypothetical protein